MKVPNGYDEMAMRSSSAMHLRLMASIFHKTHSFLYWVFENLSLQSLRWREIRQVG